MKRLTVVGRGTVGCLAVSHFIRWTDWEINWVHDPVIQPTAVGEGTTLVFPRSLAQNVDFDSTDMLAIGATPKLGIWKRGWGNGTEFYHSFPSGLTGMHFNAVQFQHHMFNKLTQNRRITVIESNETDYENLDSDYVMVCTGSPTTLTDEYIIKDRIPVNSCVVFQCPWDNPRFNHSMTFARQHGWVFGIPLKNRCSIGYLYNKDLATSDMIKDDIADLLTEFNLTPESTRELSFNNYARVTNFTDKVCYNGNASFFLEPLEATSTSLADDIIRISYDVWAGISNPKRANATYHSSLSEIESMICLHYFSGSEYDTKFWEYARQLTEVKISEDFLQKTPIAFIIKHSLYQLDDFHTPFSRDVGTWASRSFNKNIHGFGIADKLIEMIRRHGI